MVTLRKRKAVEPPPPKTTGKSAKSAKATKAAKAAVEEAVAKDEKLDDSKQPAAAQPTTTEDPKEDENKSDNDKEEAAKKSADPPSKGSSIDLDGFGGEITTNDGTKVTLKELVDKSGAGVVLFTYPKASTPGCTNQVCLFRDSYTPLTAGGLAIYGLSADSTKANTTFKEKQKLPYPLLCDPSATLIQAIGLKKQPKGTQRGVFVVDKSGKVLAAEPGGPAATVEVVKKLVEEMGA